ncbi:MAG: glycosyltransferase family 25 protein [Mastigocoleus sp.]
MKFIEFFDRVYIINLPERVDRRKGMEKELKNVGIPFNPQKVEFFSAIRPDSPGSFQSIGYRGAFLSHLNVLKRAKELQLNNVLVMEDDLAFSEHFNEYEDRLIEQLQQTNWDLVQFGYFPVKGIIQPTGSTFATYQPFSGEIIGSHFYGVNGKTLDRLINFFEILLSRPAGHPEGGPMSPDGVFNVFPWQNKDIVRLISIPSFGGQRSSRSDCHADLKWFDRLPVFQQGATLVRSMGIVNKMKSIINK